MNIKDKYKPNAKTRSYLSVITIFITFLLAGTAAYCFSAPLQSKEEKASQTLTQKLTITPTVIPTTSALYPQPQPLGEQKTYFTRVTEKLQVAIKAEILPTPETPVEGTSKVLLQLQADDLWERNYVLSPEKEFRGAGPMAVIDQTFDIPVQQILAFVKQVEEETQVYPNNGYTLNVNPVIKARATGNDEILANDFAPSFPIKLTQREITPMGETVQENSTIIRETATAPGSIEMMGRSVPVLAARYVTGTLTILSACLAIWLFKLRDRDTNLISEAQSINRRYRGRMVTAKSDIIDPDMVVIRLATFKELLKLADESDKSIICISEDENTRHICRYCIPDGKILYCYVASDDVPGTIITQQTINEHAIN